jgi:hypothetical protein
MESIDTQAQFERLWFSTDTDAPSRWIVYFTAAWCGPCKRLDLDAIQAAAGEKGIQLYKCDYVVNEYTSGYCGIRAFPSFVCMKPKAIMSTLKSAETAEVIRWIQSLP